jgi:replicative DNA helicase
LSEYLKRDFVVCLRQIHKIIFQTCKNHLEKNIEINKANILLLARVSSGYNDEQLFSNYNDSYILNSESLRSMAKVLRNKQILIEAISTHKSAIDQLHQLSATASIDTIFSVSEDTLFGLVKKFSSSQEEIIDVKSIAKEIVNYWESNPTQYVGLPTPWPSFNESIGGGMRTGVTLIGSRAGVGKTSISINIANFLCEQGIPVLILDTEMEIKDVLPRMISNISDIPIRKIETGDFAAIDFERTAVYNAVDTIQTKYDLSYVTISGKSFNEILSIIRRWIYTHVGLNSAGKANQCLVIYDYFKIMDSSDISDMQEYQAMGFQVSKLTDFCKVYDIPCLSFVQLNRDGIAKESSDVIAQSDRLLWLVNSFSLFKIKTLEEIKSDGEQNGNRKMITLKSRYGGEHQYGQYISMAWKGSTCTLKEVSKP